jgi:hypothetical protein
MIAIAARRHATTLRQRLGGKVCTGEASVLQHAGLLVPGTALTAFGLRTAKNITKQTAPMPKVKGLRTSFIINS